MYTKRVLPIMRIVIPIFVFTSIIFSEFIPFTNTIPLGHVLDLDSGKGYYAEYQVDGFDHSKHTHTEFGLFGQGLTWMFADGRIYAFFTNTFFAHCSANELDDTLDLSDTIFFSKKHDAIETGPCNEKIAGVDSNGIYISTQEHPVSEDFDTSQFFVILTNEFKYCLFKVSTFFTSYNSYLGEFCLDSIAVNWWLQNDGTTNFKDFLSQTAIHEKSIINKPKHFNNLHNSIHPLSINSIKIFDLKGRIVNNNYSKCSREHLSSNLFIIDNGYSNIKIIVK